MLKPFLIYEQQLVKLRADTLVAADQLWAQLTAGR